MRNLILLAVLLSSLSACSQTKPLVTTKHGNTRRFVVATNCTTTRYYLDANGDGYGDDSTHFKDTCSLTPPVGYVIPVAPVTTINLASTGQAINMNLNGYSTEQTFAKGPVNAQFYVNTLTTTWVSRLSALHPTFLFFPGGSEGHANNFVKGDTIYARPPNSLLGGSGRGGYNCYICNWTNDTDCTMGAPCTVGASGCCEVFLHSFFTAFDSLCFLTGAKAMIQYSFELGDSADFFWTAHHLARRDGLEGLIYGAEYNLPGAYGNNFPTGNIYKDTAQPIINDGHHQFPSVFHTRDASQPWFVSPTATAWDVSSAGMTNLNDVRIYLRDLNFNNSLSGTSTQIQDSINSWCFPRFSKLVNYQRAQFTTPTQLKLGCESWGSDFSLTYNGTWLEHDWLSRYKTTEIVYEAKHHVFDYSFFYKLNELGMDKPIVNDVYYTIDMVAQLFASPGAVVDTFQTSNPAVFGCGVRTTGGSWVVVFINQSGSAISIPGMKLDGYYKPLPATFAQVRGTTPLSSISQSSAATVLSAYTINLLIFP